MPLAPRPSPLICISWNVNSIRSRLSHLQQVLREQQPDVVMLQELKCAATEFPHLEIQAAGYHAYVHGQKTYNGVAVLSKQPAKIVTTTLPGDDSDLQARFIDVELPGGWRVISVYVPNGQEVGSEKYAYKLAFLRRLCAYAQTLLASEGKIIIGGDYNVALTDADVHDPKTWQGQILCSPPERQAVYALLHQGWRDTYRQLHPDAHDYSWWDYRGGGFERNLGLRIDYILSSPAASDRLQTSAILRDARGWEKPSDHAPVMAAFIVDSK